MGEPGMTPSPTGGLAFGDTSQVPAEARLECKICWWVYDPTEGDSVWQIAPGTPFAALPPHWRCPQCDAEASKFLLLTD